MRTVRGLLAVGVCASACVAAPTVSAAPVRGAYYVADSPGIERPLFLRVSADGRRLTTYLFASRIRCSDGRTRDFGLDEHREKRFGLTADGRFDHTSSSRRYKHRSSAPITGVGSARVVGRFDGDQAAIRFTNMFTGPTSCIETIPLTFRRVGSPGVPPSDSLMTTGRYAFSRAGSGPRIRLGSVRTVGPARLVEGVRVSWSVRRCARGGRNYRDQLSYLPLVVSAAGRLRLTESQSYSLGRGFRARTKATLTLRFRRRGSYVLTGTWKATSRIYRRGRQVDTCRTSQPFRAASPG